MKRATYYVVKRRPLFILFELQQNAYYVREPIHGIPMREAVAYPP